jgi:hypothetical protein
VLRRGFATAIICGLDAVALLFLRPDFAETGRRLAEAHRWLAASGPDAALAELAMAALWFVAAWLGLGLGATLLARVPGVLGRAGAAASRRMLPAALRRLVAGSVGVGIVLAPVSAAMAAPTATAGHPAAAVAVRDPGAGHRLPAPVWPVGPPSVGTPETRQSRSTGPSPGRQPAGTQPVHVRAGDSLWLIAARRLGPSADASRVAATWPRWYRANRAVIGDDPDLIIPGQLLTPPSASSNAPQR